MAIINQKEYLKKYLSHSNKDEKKKKRKKQPAIGDRVQIIDDDIDLSTITTFGEATDLLNANEDAPQIVGVIDERPMHMRIDDYRKSDLWKPLGAADDSQASSPQRVEQSDSSPPRRRRKDSSPPRRKRKISSVSQETDLPSPPRRIKRSPDSSPPRRRQIDSSSPRRNQRELSTFNSPLRKRQIDIQRNISTTPPRRKRTPDISPPRQNRGSSLGRTKSPENRPHKLLPGDKKGKYLIPAKRTAEKMTKTLDGKSAGLQSAQDLVKESKAFRQREDDLFKNMSLEISGANAVPVMRDRKTGKIRDLEKEAEARREKEKAAEANKEKYSRWGKGLKQVEAYEDKLTQDLHEMNKPLARYADDEDLERYLKEQERDGDPMLAYIRKKKKKKIIESGTPLKPQYEGEFMPNRYGVVPGHRWDGVDRSNGYEKKWFEVQNAKQAQLEEIYKWSTEDM